MSEQKFPPFSLSRLLKTVFDPKQGERVALLIDLEEPRDIKDFAFLEADSESVQSYAHKYIYKNLHDSVMNELGLKGGDIFCSKETGASNLDLPDEAFTPTGEQVSLEKDVYQNYDIILCSTNYSATAPLTAFAKKYGFRGATMHGLNQVIIDSGLSVDYEEVSREAEKLRKGMSKADAVEIDFQMENKKFTLRLELGGQEAQKSHGLCKVGPDVANLPAGEVYFVPTGASGQFPLKFEEDGTLAIMNVENMRIQDGEFVSGNKETFEAKMKVFKSDPAAADIGELGFGTQVLPVSGRDIQDEKVLGTLHVATGRSDHLGGDITPDLFKEAKNASHEDILFAPHKTPEINVPQARLYRDGKVEVLIENYKPAKFMQDLLAAS